MELRKFMEDEKGEGRDVSNVRPSPFRGGAFLVLRSALVESQNPIDCYAVCTAIYTNAHVHERTINWICSYCRARTATIDAAAATSAAAHMHERTRVCLHLNGHER